MNCQIKEFAIAFKGNPLIFLKVLNGQICNQFPEKLLFTEQTLPNAVDGMIFTVKLIRDCPVD